MKPLLITASLLSSFQWYFVSEAETARAEFLAVLKKERTPDNEAMQAGRAFETRVRLACSESSEWLTDHDQQDLEKTSRDTDADYNACVEEIADEVRGGVWQVAVSKIVIIDGVQFLLYGRLDVLKGAWVTDLKFSETFEIGKYRDAPQTKMYLELVPEVVGIKYLVSNGNNTFEDAYRREDVDSIIGDVQAFWSLLKTEQEFMKLYQENWQSKY